MNQRRDGMSSYLQYLPPVLWEKEALPSALPLGDLLKLFEKILTGIDDSIPIPHSFHAHQPIQATIDGIPQLFNPWYTPHEFLDWLASWVALTLPTNNIWDDYQKRKAISQIVQVYRQRGLKAGLNRYLDLYTVAEKRPRIVVDDCNALLFAWPGPEIQATICASGVPGPYVGYDTSNKVILFEEGLVRPTCIALARDGSLFLGDQGTPGSFAPVIPAGVWHVLPPEQAQLNGTSAHPQRLFPPSSWNLHAPVAVVVDQEEVQNLYVLDNVEDLEAVENLEPAEKREAVDDLDAVALYKVISPLVAKDKQLRAIASKGELGLIYPAAMALDPANGHLLILDRGTDIFNARQTAPAVIDVDVQAEPVSVTRYSVVVTNPSLLEPLSLLVMDDGALLIGDAQKQDTTLPADLIRVMRTANPTWTGTRLLSGMSAQQNPLVAPSALVQTDNQRLLVLDIGLRPYLPIFNRPRPIYIRLIAEPASIYQVRLSEAGPVVVQASESRQLVFPTGMVWYQGQLSLCDKGEYSDPDASGERLRVWRVWPHEFGVVIHFSEQRQTTEHERRQISQSISDIIEQEKPAHTLATMAYKM